MSIASSSMDDEEDHMLLGAISGFNPLAMLGGMAATKAVDAVSGIFGPERDPQAAELQPVQLDKEQQQVLDTSKIEDAAKLRLAWFTEQNPTAQAPAEMDSQQRSQLEETLRKKTEDHVRALTGKTSGGLVNLVA
jgi:hypothetical protein